MQVKMKVQLVLFAALACQILEAQGSERVVRIFPWNMDNTGVTNTRFEVTNGEKLKLTCFNSEITENIVNYKFHGMDAFTNMTVNGENVQQCLIGDSPLRIQYTFISPADSLNCEVTAVPADDLCP